MAVDGLSEAAADVADLEAFLEAKRGDDGARFSIDELRAELGP